MKRLGSITDDQRKSIVNLIKNHVKEQKNCRVGWAAKEIVKEDVQFHILDKIAAEIIENPRYTKESANPNFEYDWNIRREPTHLNSRLTLISTIVTVVLTIFNVVYPFLIK